MEAMEEMTAKVNFILHPCVRRALEREALDRDIPLSEACRRAMYAGMALTDWASYRRDSVVVLESVNAESEAY